jgi:hypothetical protein
MKTQHDDPDARVGVIESLPDASDGLRRHVAPWGIARHTPPMLRFLRTVRVG